MSEGISFGIGKKVIRVEHGVADNLVIAASGKEVGGGRIGVPAQAADGLRVALDVVLFGTVARQDDAVVRGDGRDGVLLALRLQQLAALVVPQHHRTVLVTGRQPGAVDLISDIQQQFSSTRAPPEELVTDVPVEADDEGAGDGAGGLAVPLIGRRRRPLAGAEDGHAAVVESAGQLRRVRVEAARPDAAALLGRLVARLRTRGDAFCQCKTTA